jgi:glucose-1-phosphate cytidylyltransferase
MKAVILAGGLGTRISEESENKPKPMINIGGKPILWHIMKIYSSFGIDDFIICCGYKGYIIKEYFANYFLHESDVTFDMKNNQASYHEKRAENWKVTLIDTGLHTNTGGRLKRIRKYLGEDDFCMTYGDGVSNVNIKELISFHKKHKKLATLTAVRPPGRFGALKIDKENNVQKFEEKPEGDGGYINGGFFVLSPKVIEYIDSDEVAWEREPLERLSKLNQLKSFEHDDFWQPMDTLREKNYLESLVIKKQAPWINW